MKVKYFDTVPAANAMCILKTGFLFVASEFGDQCVFLFGSDFMKQGILMISIF